ncbi:MAG TPA: hypothetical protein ENJ40_02490 [Thermosulfurimonas dismutans]|uniref:Nucleoside phosphorylase domain-containing protein n=1 Tax=Thermosulfurimonas dismutans TaxID=999894 RepID=A0A7C3CM96_9BACT|nr:hypothetical protein [Thermosulfurimonas dismutans]
MLLENLVAAGVREVWVWGWCGSLREELSPGTILVPEKALSAEGTSAYYLPGTRALFPEPELVALWKKLLSRVPVRSFSGTVVSTDAPYREDESFRRRFRKQALAVDMECSALFAAAQKLGIKLAAALLVTDRLSPEGHETLPPSVRRKIFETLLPAFRRIMQEGPGPETARAPKTT